MMMTNCTHLALFSIIELRKTNARPKTVIKVNIKAEWVDFGSFAVLLCFLQCFRSHYKHLQSQKVRLPKLRFREEYILQFYLASSRMEHCISLDSRNLILVRAYQGDFGARL